MIRNYFVVALRNLKKNKLFSAINIFGLAISMSVCLGIIMLVADQLTYDRHNSKRDRVFRVNTRYLDAHGLPAGNDYSTAPLPVASTLLEEYTNVEKAVRIRRGFGNGWIEFDQDVSIPLAGFFADPDALDVFELKLKHGDPASALSNPFSVVVTEKAAKKLFTDHENPVGKTVKVGDLGEYTVTGVIEENGAKSHIVFEALASFSTINSLIAQGKMTQNDIEWENFTGGWVYVLLKEPGSVLSVEKNLQAIANTRRPGKHMGTDERKYGFYLQNLCSITPGPFINNAIGPFMPKVFVYFFGGLALIVMLTSCFNYTNLSIARSLNRAKEIGVRKVNGAGSRHIFVQFLSESIILSLIALLVAVGLLVVVKPFLLNLRFAQILKWDLEANYTVYGVFILFSIIVGTMAGFFPAVVLSRFEILKVLKKGASLRVFSRINLRKSLIVCQLSLSLVFIISVVLLYDQLNLFMRADHGFAMNDKYNVRLNGSSFQALKQELSKYPNLISISGSSHVPATGMTRTQAFKHELIDNEALSMDYFDVEENYLENMSIRLIAGAVFDPRHSSVKDKLLINEVAVQKLNLKSPHDAVGKILFDAQDSSRYEVIGVVENYNHQVLVDKIDPMALRFNPEGLEILQVKYSGPAADALMTIEAGWKKVNPSQRSDVKFFEDEVKGFYNTVFSDFVSIIGVISFMAIVISCLGLLGMATYSTEVRMKEISIRKVLGSSSSTIVFLLSKSFLVLLAVAISIATPLAFMVNNLWLQHVAYRASFGIQTIAIGVSILTVLGLLTIGSQTFKAAFANPAKALRSE
jgi:putative ABC transport system permease protein